MVSYKTQIAQAIAGLAVLRVPKVRLPPVKEAVCTNKESRPLKPFARSEREELREHFVKRAGEAPIPNPFDPESMRSWDEYVQEMHELERPLLKFPTADAQYAALMHFWKMYGLIERPPAARKYEKVTMEEKIKAFNLHHAGKSLTEISKEQLSPAQQEMNCDRIERKHKPLSKDEISRIRLMRQSGSSLRDITEKMGRTHSTIEISGRHITSG
ncbi:MAG: helix-turn-helix domain-containing protein [Euryarchaeota archaeon]|nr:helix-turn-helix domain-containing protein [Euryarchaeota archaeon]